MRCEKGPLEAASLSRPTLTFNSRAFLRRIGTQKTTREYQDRQVVYSQGDAADAMFHIQNGSVKLVVASPRGKLAVTAILGPGDLFGEGCLGKQSLRMSTATATQLSTISRVSKRACWFASSNKSLPLQSFLSPTCFLVWFAWKKISWTGSSISARNAWPGHSCCLRDLARKVETELHFPKSIRNNWPKWSAPPGRGSVIL